MISDVLLVCLDQAILIFILGVPPGIGEEIGWLDAEPFDFPIHQKCHPPDLCPFLIDRDKLSSLEVSWLDASALDLGIHFGWWDSLVALLKILDKWSPPFVHRFGMTIGIGDMDDE